MSKHTPGPWVMGYDRNAGEMRSPFGSWHVGPAFIPSTGESREQQEEAAYYARLFDQAPALLDALRHCLVRFEKCLEYAGNDPETAAAGVERYRQLIAKIEGDAP